MENDGLKILQDIGAQQIHLDTHISKHHIQALLHQSFEDMNRVQFLGFISILEKEYGVDLKDIEKDGLEQIIEFDEKNHKEHKIFLIPEKKRTYKTIYMLIVIVILIIGAVLSISNPLEFINQQQMKIKRLDNKVIKTATEEIIPKSKPIKIIDKNITKDLNATKNIELNSTKLIVVKELNTTEVKIKKIEVKKVLKEKKSVVKFFRILPKSKIWMGYIDLDSFKKNQKVIKNRWSINPSKNWIIVFGHSNVKIQLNDKTIKEFSGRKRLRLLYKDGKLSKITLKKFKELNQGKKW